MNMDPKTAFDLAKLIQSIGKPSIDYIAAKLTQTSAKVKSRISKTFEPHLNNSFNKCSKINTIFHGEQDINLFDMYQNIYIQTGNKIAKDEDIYSQPQQFKRVVIIGTGGAGKTMMTKYIVCLHCSNPNGRIPIYVELRNLILSDERDLEDLIYDSVVSSRDKLDKQIYIEALEQGIFNVILDGFDEISPDFVDIAFRKIQIFEKSFEKCGLIVTARPEIDVRPWAGFDVYKVVPLTQSQSYSLIQRIPFNEELKEKFLKQFDDNFFKQHKSFLEIPLLAVLMMVTFKEFAEIPSRITTFYDQAFETLYRKHDISKDVFRRKKQQELSPDKFRYLFMAFCFLSLLKSKFSFTDNELREFIKKSASITECEIDCDLYAADLVSSVCVLLRDGLDVHFLHRSFQDYFAAQFILRYRSKKTYELVDEIVKESFNSAFLDMVYDLDQATLEQEWVLPKLDEIITFLESKGIDEPWEKLLSEVCGEYIIHNDIIGSVHVLGNYGSEFYSALSHLDRVYGTTLNFGLTKWIDVNSVEVSGYKDNYEFMASAAIKLDNKFKEKIEPKLLNKGYISLNNRDDSPFKLNKEFIDQTNFEQNLRKTVDNIYRLRDEVHSSVIRRKSVKLFD